MTTALPIEHINTDSRLEKAVPWASSFLMHAAFALIATFAFFAAIGGKSQDADHGFIVPTGNFDDTTKPPLDIPDNKESSTTAMEKAMQNLIKKDANGIDQLGELNALKLTTGDLLNRPGEIADFIAVGDKAGGSADGFHSGTGGPGLLAPYGPGLRDGGLFNCNISPRAKRIVYLLDHSGSMLDSFDFLRQEVIDRTSRLLPVQQYSVIMFSEDVTVLGPEHLQRATPDVKADVASQLRKISAKGMNNDLLEPFQNGFQKAFAMKPDVIIFLTDGNFDPHLVNVVKQLNKDKVQIQTIAFIEITPSAEESLKLIAKDAGGQYKFIAKKDLK